MGKRWYVIQTKPSHEKQVKDELKACSYTVFYPTWERREKKRGKVISTILPLFPNYLFVNFDIKRFPRWKKINSVKGVLGILGATEDYIPPIAKGCIESLIEQADRRGNISIEKSFEKIIDFVPGMALKIRGDAYAGLVGKYISSDAARVSVLLTLLGREISVILPISSVQALNVNQGKGGAVLPPTSKSETISTP